MTNEEESWKDSRGLSTLHACKKLIAAIDDEPKPIRPDINRGLC